MMGTRALTLFTVLLAGGLVGVTASALLESPIPVGHTQPPTGTVPPVPTPAVQPVPVGRTPPPTVTVDDDHDHDHEEDEGGDHDDHSGEHDEHHDEHVKAMKALREVIVEIDAAIGDVAKEGGEASAIGHIEHAMKELASATETEAAHEEETGHDHESLLMHGPNGHEHEHSAEKLKHAHEHLDHALKDLQEHKEDESEEAHAEHTSHATKDLATAKEMVTHALSDGLRACATGEVEHALRDLLKAMIAVSGPKAADAAAHIEHAKGDLTHAVEDLKGLPDAEHKFEQDSHALEDIEHALEDLDHALGDLKAEGEDTDTAHMMKDLKHAMADLKCANEDLHTAHALSDLHCALHDLGHIAEHADDKAEMAHVAECIAHDITHAASLAVASEHLYKSYGARLVKAGQRLQKKPSSARSAAYTKKYIDKSIAVIQKKCEKHHKKVMKAKCKAECNEAQDSCVNTAQCKKLADYAKNEKACWALSKGTCKSDHKVCKAKCKQLKHAGHDENGKGRLPVVAPNPSMETRL